MKIEELQELLLDTTISSTGKTITVECESHETKDALLNLLTGVTVLELNSPQS